MKTFVVIGLGRFGSSVAKKISDMGNEVLAIDENEETVLKMADYVTHAVTGDAKDENVLRHLGVRNYDCAIVAISEIEDSVLITLSLKEMGVKQVICKAQSSVHAKLLQKVGADRVVFPEHEMGIKLGQSLVSQNMLDYIELSATHSITEILAPRPWADKTIRDLNIRVKHGTTILAVRRANNGEVIVSPQPGYMIEPGDILIIVGKNEDLSRVQEL